jgi:hypothetical protein
MAGSSNAFSLPEKEYSKPKERRMEVSIVSISLRMARKTAGSVPARLDAGT